MGNKCEFDDLDFKFLVAGELKVLSTDEISYHGLKDKIELLNDVLFNAGFYDWSAIKRSYSLVLS